MVQARVMRMAVEVGEVAAVEAEEVIRPSVVLSIVVQSGLA